MGYFQKLFRPMGCNEIFQKIFVPWDGIVPSHAEPCYRLYNLHQLVQTLNEYLILDMRPVLKAVLVNASQVVYVHVRFGKGSTINNSMIDRVSLSHTTTILQLLDVLTLSKVLFNHFST